MAVDPAALLHGWLVAAVLCAEVALGSLGLLMIHALTGGRWGRALARPLQAAALMVPLTALLFVPVVMGARHLFPWADPARVAASHALEHRAAYLNLPFFAARTVGSFALWSALAGLLVVRLRRGERPAGLAAGGLVLLFVTVTLAAVDWLLSLDPAWSSSIVGLYLLSGLGLCALALATLVTLRGGDAIADPGVRRDLGSLLLALVVLHHYLAFAQWLITWAGNLPPGVAFYLRRFEGDGTALAVAVVVVQLVIPLLALLSPDVKRSPRALAAVCALVLAGHVGGVAWWVLPACDGASRAAIVAAGVLTPLGVGALWLAGFARLLRRAPVVA